VTSPEAILSVWR